MSAKVHGEHLRYWILKILMKTHGYIWVFSVLELYHKKKLRIFFEKKVKNYFFEIL